ncbi:MAG: DUF1501 domain-containing protein [Verrucomicrobiales bacterium]|nr:DUF1501 domain-containing protein [Verrucomicrobiae bacterium]MCP5552449.1 DUF1501 domain-containing protein [Akkermansiaceae bacterium]
MKNQRRFCDGVNRRDFLRIGAAGGLGMHLPLARLLAAESDPRAARQDVSFIYVFLTGGLSTIDTFDLKPDAPSNIRGTFQPRRTNVPGIHVSGQIPNIAGVMDKFSLVRSFGHRNAGHGQADHYMLTGYHPNAAFNTGLKPNNQQPSLGSVIANEQGSRGNIPPYVCLPTMHNSASAAYLGPKAVPFVIEADPAAPGFEVPDLQPPLAVDASRLEDRRGLLSKVDRFQRSAEQQGNENARQLGAFSERAVDLMTSQQAKQAFDIHQEKPSLRDAYGRNTLGQSCLMARRLVEAGVRCVTIEHSNWDTHTANFSTLKDDLLPKLDLAMSSLFRDLADRGLLEKTIVLFTGEFGRTPQINKDAGRDHWSRCFSIALGGGGIQGGRAVGKSDKWAMDPAEDAYGPEDMAATIYHLLGIPPHKEMITPEGRPVMLSNGGRLIRELL